jgi:hypothetical protein
VFFLLGEQVKLILGLWVAVVCLVDFVLAVGAYSYPFGVADPSLFPPDGFELVA